MTSKESVPIWIVLIVLIFSPCLATPIARAAQSRDTKKPAELKLASVNINQASEGEFIRLPGVGPELANRIVAYRAKHGPFRRLEDLMVIRGIGRKKWRAIEPYLRLGP